MKKLIAVFMSLMLAAVVISSMTVMASARNWIISPIASTYTDTTKYTDVEHDDDTTKHTGYFTRPGKTTNPGESTKHGGLTKPGDNTNPGGTTKSTPGGTTKSTPGGTNANHVTGVVRPATKNYNTNSGKDDPKSPNYTGKREISSDKNVHSPDTNAQSNVAGIAAFAVCSIVAVAAVTCMKKYKEED